MQLYSVIPGKWLSTALIVGLSVASQALAQSASEPTAAAINPPTSASPLFAQSVTAMGGQFFYDRGGDLPYPLATVRYTRPFGRFLLGETALGYAHVKSGALKWDGLEYREIATPLLLADVGLLVQLPLGPVAPFAGITGSLFRRAGSEAVDPIMGVGAGAAGGLRVRVGRSVFLRAEVHVRSDYQRDGDLLNASQTVGFGYSF